MIQLKLKLEYEKDFLGKSQMISQKKSKSLIALMAQKYLLLQTLKAMGLPLKALIIALYQNQQKTVLYKFLVPLILGSKTSLYQYGINTKGSGSTMGSSQVFYTFEKADNTYLFLTNILNKKFKSELKEFYKENSDVQHLIDTKLQYWLDMQKDLTQILHVYNKS